MRIYTNYIDLFQRAIYPAIVTIENGMIQSVQKEESLPHFPDHYMIPPFVDAHIHIESSMLLPTEFARIATTHGTVGTVSDPHEIANVLGVEGVEYMLDNARLTPFKFNFGAPSCVPATTFETSGAVIDAQKVKELLQRDDIKYLAEVMNWPGVLSKDPEVMQKIHHAHALNKAVDGHAPGLKGQQAKDYIAAGISTDHECVTIEEAIDKLNAGMKVQIREGSAAKNFEALIPLVRDYPKQLMFCTDDKHPQELIHGHINELVKRALKEGYDLYDVLKMASYNIIDHYQLDIGYLQEGQPADFVLIRDLDDFEILETYIDGVLVAKDGEPLLPSAPFSMINKFGASPKVEEDFIIKSEHDLLNVIVAHDGALITSHEQHPAKKEGEVCVSDTERDLLKIVVVNRYHDAPPAVAFIKGFQLQQGALASSVSHDSHNIVAVGVDDTSITQAVNAVIHSKGGVAVAHDFHVEVLPLPIAGLMSDGDVYSVGKKYEQMILKANVMGSKLVDPFMTMSFMALLVIPSLKLSDLGLFDGLKFQFISNVTPS